MGRAQPPPLRGDETPAEALPLLVEAYGGQLHALARRFCGSEDEAEDLVQETFLNAYRAWDQFQGQSDPGTWLYTIAARACQRFHRRRSGEPDQLESLQDLLPFDAEHMPRVPGEDDPLAQALREEALEGLEQAIGQLPVEFRMPLVLKELVGLSLAQVGQVLGLPAGTVKTRVHRARLKLRQVLEQVLPQQPATPPTYSLQVCLDLLDAKQEALDRGHGEALPQEILCGRCQAVFASLDLSQDLCLELGQGRLPEGLRARLLEGLAGPPQDS